MKIEKFDFFNSTPVLNPQFLAMCSSIQDDVKSKIIEDDLNNFTSEGDFPPNPPYTNLF